MVLVAQPSSLNSHLRSHFHIAFDGIPEIPDQIVAPFQLESNLFPAVGGL